MSNNYTIFEQLLNRIIADTGMTEEQIAAKIGRNNSPVLLTIWTHLHHPVTPFKSQMKNEFNHRESIYQRAFRPRTS